VKGLTLNEVAKRKCTTQQFAILDEGSDSGNGGGDQSSQLEDRGLGPVALACSAEDRERILGALNVIADERHREAIILHDFRGWPITSQDPTIPTLCSHFGGITPRQISNWLKGAMAEMRNAIGEKS